MTLTSSAEQRGFTLLELLVVLSIIALGVGLIAPNIGLTDNSVFTADVRKAAATLSYARRLAIVQAAPVTIELHSGVPDAAEEDVAAALSEEQARRHWRSELIQLRYQDDLQPAAEQVDDIAITFFPQGGSTGGTLHFSRNQRSAQIRISAMTGRIRVAWDGEEPNDDA
jgi:general secretion pathway protein H